MREFTRKKCQGPRDHTGDHTLREPAQSRCTWTFPKTNFTLYTEIYRKNAAAQNRDTDFVRACAVEMHVDISQEPLYTGIYSKNAAAQMEHPDQAPAFILTVRTTGWTHFTSLLWSLHVLRGHGSEPVAAYCLGKKLTIGPQTIGHSSQINPKIPHKSISSIPHLPSFLVPSALCARHRTFLCPHSQACSVRRP